MYSCTLIDRFTHKKRFSHNIVFFLKKKKTRKSGETSELLVLWAEVVLLLPHVPVQTLRQALEPVVDRVLETDGRDGEAGSGDGDTGRRGWGWGAVEEKEKRFSDRSLQTQWHKGRAVDMARCNFLLRVSVCARASLTHSYGQIEDNLWMSHIKKKQNKTMQSCYTSLRCPQNPLRRLRNGRCKCRGGGPRS